MEWCGIQHAARGALGRCDPPRGPTSICSRWICCRLTAAGVRMFHTDLGSGIKEGGGQGSREGGAEIGDRTSSTPLSAVTAGNCLHGIRRPQRWEGAKFATAGKLRNRRHPPNPQSNQRRARRVNGGRPRLISSQQAAGPGVLGLLKLPFLPTTGLGKGQEKKRGIHSA